MGYLKNYTKCLKIIIFRDPANFIASYFKHVNEEIKETKKVIKLYISYLQSYENKENFLFVNYNKFITDKFYRKIISKQIP
tara:strand:- start:78 stop:320 length:243 start_codon:yes stop_codon:yes gene_type:complete